MSFVLQNMQNAGKWIMDGSVVRFLCASRVRVIFGAELKQLCFEYVRTTGTIVAHSGCRAVHAVEPHVFCAAKHTNTSGSKWIFD